MSTKQFIWLGVVYGGGKGKVPFVIIKFLKIYKKTRESSVSYQSAEGRHVQRGKSFWAVQLPFPGERLRSPALSVLVRTFRTLLDINDLRATKTELLTTTRNITKSLKSCNVLDWTFSTLSDLTEHYISLERLEIKKSVVEVDASCV